MDPAGDPAMIRVPPMLLQPYVENAIWHGLMHREDGGRLLIRVSGSAAWTRVEIADNGVGREQAAFMRSKTASGEKSHGTRITQERIDVHNRLGISRIEVETQDIVPDAGGGTRVVLQIHYPPETTA
jgi:LytS/YehU family sensor histidine kinase